MTSFRPRESGIDPDAVKNLYYPSEALARRASTMLNLRPPPGEAKLRYVARPTSIKDLGAAWLVEMHRWAGSWQFVNYIPYATMKGRMK